MTSIQTKKRKGSRQTSLKETSAEEGIRSLRQELHSKMLASYTNISWCLSSKEELTLTRVSEDMTLMTLYRGSVPISTLTLKLQEGGAPPIHHFPHSQNVCAPCCDPHKDMQWSSTTPTSKS